MKIIRDGKEIELTAEELRSAYWEQEHLFDIEDVVSELEYRCEFDSNGAAQKILEDPELISDIADEKRHEMDEYEVSWYDATQTAIDNAIEKMKGD